MINICGTLHSKYKVARLTPPVSCMCSLGVCGELPVGVPHIPRGAGHQLKLHGHAVQVHRQCRPAHRCHREYTHTSG